MHAGHCERLCVLFHFERAPLRPRTGLIDNVGLRAAPSTRTMGVLSIGGNLSLSVCPFRSRLQASHAPAAGRGIALGQELWPRLRCSDLEPASSQRRPAIELPALCLLPRCCPLGDGACVRHATLRRSDSYSPQRTHGPIEGAPESESQLCEALDQPGSCCCAANWGHAALLARRIRPCETSPERYIEPRFVAHSISLFSPDSHLSPDSHIPSDSHSYQDRHATSPSLPTN